MSVSINIDKVVKKYGDTVVVNGLSVDIMPGEFFTLLGPSGCGKTTLLRMIIGFNSIEGGTISVDGNVINDVATDKRNMGMVFQNYAIFPHMSVKDNVAFGLRMRKVPEKEIEERVDKILKIVKIDHLKDRMPTALSGGQQQRVALARAIVIRPQVLLMDEPLSNLDAKLRVQLRNELKKMQREFGITTIYVTHDQEEALTLSDRIAVFNKGYIEQIGTPNEIYNHSKTEFVCNFIGDINRVEAPIAAKMKLAAGQNHFIRLERLHVNKPKRDDEILIDGVVENIEYYGLYIKYYIDVGSQILKAIEKNDGINIYAPGEKVTVAMKPTDVMSYDAQ